MARGDGPNPASDLAVVGNRVCSHLLDFTNDLTALEGEGFWAVLIPFDGPPACARFADVRQARPWPGLPWFGPDPASWRSSMTKEDFYFGVEAIRSAIADGEVYQVNLTRRISASLRGAPPGWTNDIAALGAALARDNPSPYHAVLRIPERGIHVASASPERFIGRNGHLVRSSPIKGTASHVDGFLPKDRAENVMIVDLVRNDLGRVCEWGTVRVPSLLAIEPHPGLVHMVSTVEGHLVRGAGWAEIVEATFPPGSVTGAPKVAALQMISQLEPVPREVYCGALGWVDADRNQGELNVTIRTFWMSDGMLHFGTGGGITWDSTPEGEWEETELKARRLLSIASTKADSGEATCSGADRAGHPEGQR